MRRRTTEADTPDPPPFAERHAGGSGGHGWCRRAGRARSGCRRGRRAGSAGRPGPLTMSLRNVSAGGAQPLDLGRDVVDDEVDAVPAARLGLRPSGIGRPAELVGPLSSSRRWPRTTSANAGAELVESAKPKWRRVEGDGRLDVVDHVADVDELVGHAR